MYKPIHEEISHLPSQLNTSTTDKGAAVQMANQLANEPQYNNETIENMRNNPLHERIDKIDKIGKAQKKLAESAEVLSKSKFVREANRKLNHPSKK